MFEIIRVTAYNMYWTEKIALLIVTGVTVRIRSDKPRTYLHLYDKIICIPFPVKKDDSLYKITSFIKINLTLTSLKLMLKKTIRR